MEGERQSLKLALEADDARAGPQPGAARLFKLQGELVEQASRYCELRRQITINDLGYKGQYKGWRPTTSQPRSGRFVANRHRRFPPSRAHLGGGAAPGRRGPPAEDTSGSNERQKKHHNPLPTIQPPSGPFRCRPSRSSPTRSPGLRGQAGDRNVPARDLSLTPRGAVAVASEISSHSDQGYRIDNSRVVLEVDCY